MIAVPTSSTGTGSVTFQWQAITADQWESIKMDVFTFLAGQQSAGQTVHLAQSSYSQTGF